MIFTFVSTSADALNSTNTALGTVIMATNYNSSQAPFASKSQMENNEFTTSAKPSVNVMHMIECDPLLTLQEGKFYVRTGNLVANQDVKTYDLGLFQLATVGSQAIATVGELHVSYDIELMKPIDLSIAGVQNQTSHFYSNTNVSTTNYFGTVQTPYFNTLGITFSSTVITLPYQYAQPNNVYLFTFTYSFSAATPAFPTISFANCVQLSVWYAQTATSVIVGNVATSQGLMAQTVIRILSTASSTNLPTLTFSSGTLGTSPTFELIVTQLPSNYA
nr:MAG: capsid protein [Cressdnaviricota sp.]